MKRTYEVRDRADKRAIREFLKREGQFLLPMLDLVEQTEVSIVARPITVFGFAGSFCPALGAQLPDMRPATAFTAHTPSFNGVGVFHSVRRLAGRLCRRDLPGGFAHECR